MRRMRVRQVGRIALTPATPPPLNVVWPKDVPFEVVFQLTVGWNISKNLGGKVSEMQFEGGVTAVTQSETLWPAATV